MTYLSGKIGVSQLNDLNYDRFKKVSSIVDVVGLNRSGITLIKLIVKSDNILILYNKTSNATNSTFFNKIVQIILVKIHYIIYICS